MEEVEATELSYKPTRFSRVTKTASKVQGLPSPLHPQLPCFQGPPRSRHAIQSGPLPCDPLAKMKVSSAGVEPTEKGTARRALQCDQSRSKGRTGVLQAEDMARAHQGHKSTR